jgi:hypothetical protein
LRIICAKTTLLESREASQGKIDTQGHLTVQVIGCFITFISPSIVFAVKVPSLGPKPKTNKQTTSKTKTKTKHSELYFIFRA